MAGPMPGRGMRGMGLTKESFAHFDKNTFKRLMGYIFHYKWRFLLVFLCIVVSALVNVQASLFIGRLIDDYIGPLLLMQTPDYTSLLLFILKMAGIYLIGIAAGYCNSLLMVSISQSVLKKIRDDMFRHMQTLPVKYFDTHSYGDVMSRYTNDTDTLRQMVSQLIPQVFSSLITIVSIFIAMCQLSLWLTLFVVVCVVAMTFVSTKLAQKSGGYFAANQSSLGRLNGYIEEHINGQKVVKVFCHEEICKEEFDQRNDELCRNATEANKISNVLGPMMNNMNHLQYVLIAILGGALAISGVGGLTVGSVASFLQLSRNFSMPINQISQQINMFIMALAGAERVFRLLDEKPETDEGYVTLVNVREENGALVETQEATGLFAWKHPHRETGTVELVPVRGEIVLHDVDFGYVPEKLVLHDISLTAQPGQKIAFVGATGAGKTTITNLINRFYDIADGKIRYDGININKIKKADLRRSLGMVLQEVNLFTGSVMDNIRYGKPGATDEECVAAAKLAGADDFISRLPQGYETELTNNGANLSVGQRQLISIARAAVADPPAMILDEATSSIDTRTETIVQRGMDALMHGRTVFVIAHRLSTVRNADVIIVLDHGRIIERGSHRELIEARGKYYQLYTGAFELD
ncbi:MAG: ABC transporter ATP-binding protein [Eubacteriales bacterium]|nr:ABC transporter ATP-binding protein [Eubacteriales bacterium]